MRRREFIARLAGTAAWPLLAQAQQAAPTRRIGFISSGTAGDSATEPNFGAFRQTLENIGWTAGRNVQVDVRYTAGNTERTMAAAAELVGLAPDVIVSVGTQATAIVKQNTSAIPIVFVNVADPIDSGFVSSWARPGGNATGFAAWEFAIGSKWLELLKQIAPNVSRVLVLLNPENPTWKGHVHTIEAAAKLLRIDLIQGHVHIAADVERAIAAFARDSGNGMIVLPSGVTLAIRKSIIDAAEQHRLPAIYPYRFHAISGGLTSFGTDPIDLYRRAAAYVDKILRGEKPNNLPVQAPTKFEFVINLKTANALGLTIPPTLLARADEVIE